MDNKPERMSAAELAALVNSQGKDFIIHVEFEYPAGHSDVMKEYASAK